VRLWIPSNSFQPKGNSVLDVHGLLGVVGQLAGAMLVEAEVLLPDPQGPMPPHPLLPPVLEPLVVGAGLHEELHLRLLELPGPEDEVPGGDLVPERLSDLGHPEGDLLAGSRLDVQEVHVGALGRLGAQVDHVGGVLHRPHEGLEHEVEEAGLPELALLRLPGVFDGFRPQAWVASWSWRKRFLQTLHSTRGSVNPSTWPEASQTRGCMRMEASSPSTSSRWWTIRDHQRSFTFRFSSIPRGP
jgi:hypothetical protein